MIKTHVSKLICKRKIPSILCKQEADEHCEELKYHIVNIDIGMTREQFGDFCEDQLNARQDFETDYIEKGLSWYFDDKLYRYIYSAKCRDDRCEFYWL